ncbi:hypothetical protein FNAPI_736 [Fusarium napiforme]|uniref:Uncharacterized protein n=1 Tax=Fusarium napiforme TaxID=42672 RepID=A0A8H5K6D5_9HYPO|nr:hypothetical protein FNAPI_736 [Fusarium napiforme]
MASAGPSKYRLATDQAPPAQNSYLADSARQSSHSIRLGSPSTCQYPTGIPKPSLEPPSRHRRYSRTSSVSSSKSSSGPSRPCSPDSSSASSVQEVSIADEEVKEPEPDLPKAPEHFKRAFSVPKALFDIYETSREWHFGFAPMQNVHALVMALHQANLKRENAEQQVRDLTQRLRSVAEPGREIQPSEHEFSKIENVTPAKLRRKRCARRKELIEHPGNISLKERFEKLAGWSEEVEADIDAAQDRNTLLFDQLGEAGKDIKRLEDEKLSLKDNKEKLEKQLEQSRKDSTMADDVRTSPVPGFRPLQDPASQIIQENRIAELQREIERLRQENDEIRNALEQPQSQDSPSEKLEEQTNDATPEEAQLRSADAGVEVPTTDVEMGGIMTGQDSTTPQDIETPVMPVAPPAAPEAEETVVLYPQRLLNSVNRHPRASSDKARRGRDSRRRRRREQQRRLEREEEEAQQRQQRRSEREGDARRPHKHHRKPLKVYKQKKKILSPLGWVRYRRTLMDFLSLSHMFSSPLELS